MLTRRFLFANLLACAAMVSSPIFAASAAEADLIGKWRCISTAGASGGLIGASILFKAANQATGRARYVWHAPIATTYFPKVMRGNWEVRLKDGQSDISLTSGLSSLWSSFCGGVYLDRNKAQLTLVFSSIGGAGLVAPEILSFERAI